MQTFCTIITADYFPKALALYMSLLQQDSSATIQMLVVDDDIIDYPIDKWKGIGLIKVEDLAGLPMVRELYNKYSHINKDDFRWALKPVLMIYLLKNNFEKVIYADCDLYFVNNFQFLFDQLDNSSMLLTPHWKNTDPVMDEISFYSTFTHGLFNAGFIGANQNAMLPLQWWAEACHYKMGEHLELGIYVDQKYLDAIPVLFENIQMVQHKGCNVAPWNTSVCKRKLVNGEVLINGIFPIVFFHFNHMLVTEISKGHDSLLKPYLEAYQKLYEDEGFSLSRFLTNLDEYTHASILKKIKWQLKIRTNLKRFLYGILQNI